jgi:NAD(P)-dependent dehydrogenase (short-subunit alcohol dehydrogenase family)
MLEDRSVVVTGGASGIGRAMVEQFAARGARVLAVDVAQDGLRELRAALPEVVTLALDLTHPDAPDAVLEAAGGHVDALNNNAGITDGLTPIDEVDDDLWDRVLMLDLTVPFRLSRCVLPSMLERGRGVITNVSSVAGLRGGRSGPAYTSAKWGLIGLTQQIAAWHGPEGIRCNAICPGATGPTGMGNIAYNERGAVLARKLPGQLGPPERIASVAVFLATDEAARINGVALPVDDGWVAY